MKRSLYLLHVVLLSGCATTGVSEFRGPDGSSIKTVKCASDPARCFAVASQSCPSMGTYRVISSESHAGGVLADILPGPVTWYGMTYACGATDGAMSDFKFSGQQYTPPPLPAPALRPIIIQQQPTTTTTNCTKAGETVTCRSY